MNALKLDSFKKINKKIFLDKNSIVSNYTELDTGIEKLRVKFNALKQDWHRITDRIKNESRLSPDKEPCWFKVGLSPSKKDCVIYLIESPLKMMKNAFYFILKALFVLKIFKFLSRLFGHVGKTA